MKSFKDFIKEAQNHVPVVSIDKHHADIKTEEGLNELNKNLSVAMSSGFSDLGSALNKAKKILSMYSVELPAIHFKDESKGSVSVDIGQHKSSGEIVHGNPPVVHKPFSEKNEHHKFTFSYELNDGVYDVSAKVTCK
jgi:hypothetical protein